MTAEERDPTLPFGWISLGLACAGILAVAGAARFWRLHWGIDEGMAFSDELQLWRRYTGDFVPLRLNSFARPDRASAYLYPTGMGYALGLSTWFSTLMGWIPSPWEVQKSGLLVGRVVAASFSVLVVGLVGLFATRLHSVRAGLFAAGLMAVAPLSVMQAHYISTDPLVVFWMTAIVWASYELAIRGEARISFGAGALAGLAFGTKYSGLLAAVAVAWAISRVAFERRSVATFVLLTAWSLLGLCVGVLVSCPLCVWHADYVAEILAFYGEITSWENVLWWQKNLAPGLGRLGHPYVYQLAVAFPYACGWAIYLLGLGGVVWAVRRRTVADQLLLVTVSVYLLSAGLSNSFEVRYLLPFVPLFVLFAAMFLADIPAKRLAAGLVSIALVYSAAVSFSQVSRFSVDQQWQVADAVQRSEARVEGATIATPSYYAAWIGLQVPFAFFELPLELREPGDWLSSDPDYFVLPDIVSNSVYSRGLARFEEDLDGLRSGRAGYDLVGTYRSDFFSSGLYTSLDPLLSSSFTQGEIGFELFARRQPRKERKGPAPASEPRS
ncbi:MAG: glycosyltransferase family 39 protein [Candidatus Binatia bacterium]|nr:glycosyltransferase family 39 protein [Candidatus Binatia bacterium]